MGNLSYINVDSFTVEDPIIQLNTGPNGAPLSIDNNFDSGVSTNYYDTADRRTFFGRKDSSGFFEYFSNVDSETGNVITGTYGTIKSGNLQLVSAATVGTSPAAAARCSSASKPSASTGAAAGRSAVPRRGPSTMREARLLALVQAPTDNTMKFAGARARQEAHGVRGEDDEGEEQGQHDLHVGGLHGGEA
jgi:hypothetical protein